MSIPPEMLEQMMMSTEEYGDRQRLKRERGLPSSVLTIGRRDPNTGLYSATSAGRGELQGRKLSNTDYRAGESVPWYSKDGRIAIDGNDWSNQPFIPQDEDEAPLSPFAILYLEFLDLSSGQYSYWFKSPDIAIATFLGTFNRPPNFATDGTVFTSIVPVNRRIYIVQDEEYSSSTGRSILRTWLIQDGIVKAKATGLNYGGVLSQYNDYLRKELTRILPPGESSPIFGNFSPGDFYNVEAFQSFYGRFGQPNIATVAGNYSSLFTVLDGKGYMPIFDTGKTVPQLVYGEDTLLILDNIELDLFTGNVELTSALKVQVLEVENPRQMELVFQSAGGNIEARFETFKANLNNKFLEPTLEVDNDRRLEVPTFTSSNLGDLRIVASIIMPPTVI